MTALVSPTDSLAQEAFQTWLWRGYRVQWLAQGSGQPIVLLHGFGASIGHWRKNIPVLAAAGYRVYAIDLLGFGGSQKPPIDYSMELWQDLVLDFWAEFIQEPALWVGNSIGALLALMLSAAAPERTRGTVLLNCAGGLNHRPEELNPVLRLVMGTFAQVVNTPGIGRFMFNQIRQKHRIRGTLKQVYGNPEAVTPELVDLLHEPSGDEGAYETFASILAAPPGPKPETLLPQIAGPLLVLWGETDPWTPIQGAKIYQDLAKTAGDRVTFVSIPKTGHCPHDERPEVVNSAIVNWLSQMA
ncbi:alpha/beta fold hydrolase [Limnothrix sp. FACHB-708]|uniref:alpha/beta fold hydrolase n=1 Tax=unclassified Limnothrix TaxID=2632864 RepID=UPI00081EA678|nr:MULTISPECIES: alpha/beta fold hydrolase [unclassified Limnothrix]MBD2552639.1 alpha/beta fold hydrolase [Limnothrix sp. FACHB-708]MBD2589909.1 alpha/beta fold hydrolase [Limnothrix sp. FACHB-406]OCQ90816.1 alpha/beta hydrolase [Limnothrix sp. P13C2]PIB15472.1 alpha/beta hydrolase [Limnothrix sp. PR1529]